MMRETVSFLLPYFFLAKKHEMCYNDPGACKSTRFVSVRSERRVNLNDPLKRSKNAARITGQRRFKSGTRERKPEYEVQKNISQFCCKA